MSDPFTNSPFALTASPEVAGCWSGRADTLNSLVRLQRSWTKRTDSSLDLMWANLGAGKSHALFHLQYLLEREGGYFIAIVEMPEQVKTFRDVFARTISVLDLKAVATVAVTGCRNENLQRCLQAILHGDSAEAGLARQWLMAGNVAMNELRKLGISQRIESDPLCSDIFVDLLQSVAKSGSRLVVMFDEFQRVATLGPRASAILSHLRSAFSKCPARFSVLISVASSVEATATSLLTRELQTLLGARKPVSLPALNREEAIAFVRGRFACFRPTDYAGSWSSPFEPDAINRAVNLIADRSPERLTPRFILQVLAEAFDDADMDNADLVTVKHVEQAFGRTDT